MRITLTNGEEAVSLYYLQGVLVLRVADVDKVASGTEKSVLINNFNCSKKMCRYTDLRCT